MKLTFLGTCSGTEPMPNCKHVSFVVQSREGQDGAAYWFDAGEGCSYTAHLAGIDLLSVRSIFITHTHMDHIGGLPNLLWNMRKLNGILKDKSRGLSGKNLKVFIPTLSVWEGILSVLQGTEGGFRINYTIEAENYQDGLVYEENDLRVIALHNRHLGEVPEGGAWQSFSFRIEAGQKSVVYSGDVADVSELAPLLDHCDLLLMETGHHKVEDVCNYLKNVKKDVARLGFIHHGRAILVDAEAELQKARAIIGDKVFIANDGLTLEL